MTVEELIVNRILDDLRGRQGIGDQIDLMTNDIYQEMKNTLEEIVKSTIEKRFPLKEE